MDRHYKGPLIRPRFPMQECYSAPLHNSVVAGVGGPKWEYDLGVYRPNHDRNVFDFSIQRMLPIQPAARLFVASCPDKEHNPDWESEEEEEEEEEHRGMGYGGAEDVEDIESYDQTPDSNERQEDEEEEVSDDEASERAEADEEAEDVSSGDDNVEENGEDEAEGEDDDDNIRYPEFVIHPHGASNGFARIGDMINDCYDHWLTCRDYCNCIEEIEEWEWRGHTALSVIQRDVHEVTGYEMLAELKRRFG